MVEYILSQQEYYLEYGSDENNLNQTSDTILSESDTSLTNQAYNISLTGLERNTLYYVRVRVMIGDYIYSSDITSFTTSDHADPGIGRI